MKDEEPELKERIDLIARYHEPNRLSARRLAVNGFSIIIDKSGVWLARDGEKTRFLGSNKKD